MYIFCFFFSSRRRHTRWPRDWSSDVCSSDLHLMAYAVKELFPEAQVTIGPVIDNGFYYDFAYERPFTPEDLEAIEKKMAEIARRDEKVEREVRSEEHTSELQSRGHIVCRLLLE